MTSKTYRTATQPAAGDRQPDPLLFAAGSYLTPSRIGKERAKAFLVLAGGAAVLWSGIHYSGELDQPILAILALVLFAAAAIYSASVVHDIEQVRRQLWTREEATGQDLDGDGYVGKPGGHQVNIGDGSFTLPDLAPPPDRRPLPHFPIPANDVIYVLDRARQTPLTVRPWDKHRLPSGLVIDRDLLAEIQDGLITWQFAVPSYTADGRRSVELRSDIDVDSMIHAVNQAIKDNAKKP